MINRHFEKGDIVRAPLPDGMYASVILTSVTSISASYRVPHLRIVDEPVLVDKIDGIDVDEAFLLSAGFTLLKRFISPSGTPDGKMFLNGNLHLYNDKDSEFKLATGAPVVFIHEVQQLYRKLEKKELMIDLANIK